MVGTIKGGTADAKHPLAPVLPRRCSARVASDVIKYLSIDSDLLDVLITWDQTGQYEVGDLRSGRRDRRRLDDAAAAEPGVPQDSAGQSPGGVHAHAAHALLRRRHRDPAGRRGRLLLRDRRRPLRRHARDAAQSRRRQAGRARQGRHLRRGSAHLRRAAQCDRVNAHGRRPDAPRQGRLQHAPQRADAAMGRLRGSTGRDRPGRPLARRPAAERIRARALRRRAQHPALLRAAQAQDARYERALRGLLRYRPTQFGGRLHPERAGLRLVRAEGRHRARRILGRGPDQHAAAQPRHADAGLTSCAWACRRRARRRDTTRSCAGCCRGPAR